MIFLIRHGQTEWNRIHRIQGQKVDNPLNDEGRAQARERAEAFDGARFSAVITSPLKRAEETARILTENADVGEFLADERFLERDYGPNEGEFSLNRPFKFYYGPMEGAEDSERLYERLHSALKDVGKRYSGNVLITTHGAITGNYVSRQTGKDEVKMVNLATVVVDPETGDLVDYNLSNDEIRKYLV